MQTSIMHLQIVIMGIYFQSVLPQTCDFVDETVAVKQPDGRFVCKCDRSKGYIGPTEYACSFVECQNHMLPDDDATCQCIDDFFKRDGQCIEKSRCKADETILHNGSRYDDRKCGKNVPVNIRHPPLVVISDVKSTSASLEVFRNANETGVQTVTFIFKDLKEDLQQQRVIETKIGETELKVSAIITGLASNTSYRVEVLTSDQGGTSDPVIFVLQTELPIVRLRAAPFVKVIEKDQVSCTLEVTPDKELDSGKIALTFRNLTDNTEGHMEKDIEKGKTVTLLKVTGLTANTSYQIDVKTDDVSGLSESRQFQVQTDANRKPEMQNDEENSSLLIVVGVITLAGVCILVAAVFIIKWRKSRRTPIQETGADSPADRQTTNLLEDGLRAEASVVIPLGEVNTEAIASEETPVKEVDAEARRPQKPMTPIQENTAAADRPADRPTTNLLEKRLQAEASVVIPLGEINAEARRPQEPMTPIQETEASVVIPLGEVNAEARRPQEPMTPIQETAADSPADRPTTNLLEKGLQVSDPERPWSEIKAHVICWGLPGVITMTALGYDMLGENFSIGTGPWCWIKVCLKERKVSTMYIWMAVTGKGWDIITYVVSMVFFILLVFYLRRRGFSISDLPRRTEHRLRQADANFVFLWLLTYVLKVWGTARFFMSMTEYKTYRKDVPTFDSMEKFLLYMQSFCDGLQAFCNCILFVFLDRTMRNGMINHFRCTLARRQPLLQDSQSRYGSTNC